jgi:methionyl-tRNA formyltransferase
MTDRSRLRVVLVAEEAAGVQTLRALAGSTGGAGNTGGAGSTGGAGNTGGAGSAVTLVAVFTGGAQTTQRGVTVAGVARKLGCPVCPGDLVRTPELADRLRNVDLLINVHSLHRIHEDVIAAPRLGSFNLHPGPLPGFAGLNAPSWAVYLGQRRHAVTLHWMAAGIDTGDVAYEAWFDLDDEATGLSVSTRCVKLGVPLIQRLLADAAHGAPGIPAIAQDLHRRRVFRRRAVPYGGRIPWGMPADELARWVRASDYHPLPSPWGYPTTRLGAQALGLAKVTVEHDLDAHAVRAMPGSVVHADERQVAVKTGNGLVMVHTVVIDGARINAADRLKPGMQLH